MSKAAFSIGQLVHHKLFKYRGVVFDVDPTFQLSEEWYAQVARSRPPKNQPWYKVLVDGQYSETYVAERNLEAEDSIDDPIDHPLVDEYFGEFRGGSYQRRHNVN